MKKRIPLGALLLLGIASLAQGYYYEESTPHNGSLKTGTDPVGIECSNCHNAPAWGTGTSQFRLLNVQCESCHNKTLTYDTNGNLLDDYSKTAAPLIRTHSAAEVGAAGGGARFGNWAAACWDCHTNHLTKPADTEVLVTGTYLSVNPNSAPGTTIFVIPSTSFTVKRDATLWGAPSNWARKTGLKRGLLVYVGYDDGSAPNTVAGDGTDDSFESFEISSVELNTSGNYLVTVKGLLSKTDTLPYNFQLYYGQLLGPKLTKRTSVATDPCFAGNNDACAIAYAHFTGPDRYPFNENSNPTDPGLVLGNDPSPNGICQICHTATLHWRNNGTFADHFNGLDCAGCHDHSAAWLPDPNVCSNCHGDPPINTLGLLTNPPSFATTSGMHKKHVDIYALSMGDKVCQICHYLGMPDTPGDTNYTDKKIQIGFGYDTIPKTSKERYDGRNNLAGAYTYAGTNGTTVTIGGEMRCYNTYCHGPGRFTSIGSDMPSFSPKWDGTEADRNGGTTCDNCHAFPPRFDSHGMHNSLGYKCNVCHYATTTDGTTITNPAIHANGKFEVVPAPGELYKGGWRERLDFTYTAAPGGGTCSNNYCHYFYNRPRTAKWAVATPLINASVVFSESCPSGNSMISPTFNIVTSTNLAAPYSCTIEWGDGSITKEVRCSQLDPQILHTYTDKLSSHTVKWTLHDSFWTSTVQSSVLVNRTCP